MDFKKKLILFEKNEAYQNYLIDQSILNSLDQIEINVFSREKFWNILKFGILYTPMAIIPSILLIPTLIPLLLSEKFQFFIFEKTKMFGLGTIIDFIDNKVLKTKKKEKFLHDNSFIINIIEEKLVSLIKDKLNENQIKEKLIIFNQENFHSKVQKIKNRMILSHNKKNITKNFNILLLGNTNVGKSTLINEFLKLSPKEKAKEGSGLETKTEEFKPYKGEYNGQIYTLYDTNGITLIGPDSIEKKMESIEKEIKKRIEKENASQLIHCIWYCFQGSSIQKADGIFIEKLLNIYTIHKIPIIFVHTKTFDKGESDICRKGLIKLLIKIYNKDKVKIKESLDNYINILARGRENEKKEEKRDELDEEFEEFYNYNNVNKDNQQEVNSFGLDDLEKLSKKEIRIKGIVSSYYEYLKNDIVLILTNTIVDLMINNNIGKIKEQISKDINKFYDTILKILNDDNFNLSDAIKAENKISLNNILNYIKNSLSDIKNNLENKLTKNNLKEDNKDIIVKIYDNKSVEYKNEINYEEFCKNVDDLIYDNLYHNSNEVINNMFNILFNVYVINSLRNGIKEQFHEMEGLIVKEIYDNLFKD